MSYIEALTYILYGSLIMSSVIFVFAWADGPIREAVTAALVTFGIIWGLVALWFAITLIAWGAWNLITV